MLGSGLAVVAKALKTRGLLRNPDDLPDIAEILWEPDSWPSMPDPELAEKVCFALGDSVIQEYLTIDIEERTRRRWTFQERVQRVMDALVHIGRTTGNWRAVHRGIMALFHNLYSYRDGKGTSFALKRLKTIPWDTYRLWLSNSNDKEALILLDQVGRG